MMTDLRGAGKPGRTPRISSAELLRLSPGEDRPRRALLPRADIFERVVFDLPLRGGGSILRQTRDLRGQEEREKEDGVSSH